MIIVRYFCFCHVGIRAFGVLAPGALPVRLHGVSRITGQLVGQAE